MSKNGYVSAARSASRLRLFKNKTLNTVIIILIILGIGAAWYFVENGGLNPTATAPETGSTAATYSEWSKPKAFKEASKKVDSLTVMESKEKYKYNRTEQFGPAWKYDFDKSGCETRDDILKVSMEDVEMKDKCQLASGTLRYDPYTGETDINMTSAEMGKELDGEHIVALENVWLSGAQLWDKNGTPEVEDDSVSDDPQERREQIANDPLNVIMVDAGQNRSKGSKDASDWLVPENTDYVCEYVTRQVEVKAKYGLGVTRAEKKTFTKTFEDCLK